MRASARTQALTVLAVWPTLDARRSRTQTADAGQRATWAAGPGAGLVPSTSAAHAERVWAAAREAVAQHAARAVTGAPADSWAGIWQLEFVGRIAAHVSSCGRCWTPGRYGREGDEPAAWLQWAIAVTPGLADIWRAVARDHGLRVQRRPPRPLDAKRTQTARAAAGRGVRRSTSR